MAKTKQRRRKKHRGTQGGTLDAQKRKPRTRAELKSQIAQGKSKGKARSAGGRSNQPGKKGPRKPSIKGAALRAGVAAAFFVVLVTVVLHQSIVPSLVLGAIAFAIYVPIGYWVDKWAYGRAMKRQGQGAERAKGRPGGDAADEDPESQASEAGSDDSSDGSANGARAGSTRE